MTGAPRALPALQSRLLTEAGFRHAFFTRQGGVSTDVYASLNGGVGSRDMSENVQENRRRMSVALGVEPEALLIAYQVHSAHAQIVDFPWGSSERPRCDGLVTGQSDLAVGATGADCGMILFADRRTRIVAAAHAGWKGALTGIVEATIAGMEQIGSNRRDIVTALGPTIGPASYEVGPEFVARFLEADFNHARFFSRSGRVGHSYFDLPAFIGSRIAASGVEDFENLGLDTYIEPERFFSYRRSVHLKEADYGRLVSAITPGAP